jgi:hypothetical protein
MQNESFLHTPISQTAEPEWVSGPGRWAHLRIGYTPSSIDFPGQPRIATLPLTNSDNEQTVATYREGNWELTIVTLPWPTYDARDNALTLCASALERGATNAGGAITSTIHRGSISVDGFDGCELSANLQRGGRWFGRALIGAEFLTSAFVTESDATRGGLAPEAVLHFLGSLRLDPTQRMPSREHAGELALSTETWPYYYADRAGMAARIPGNPHGEPSMLRSTAGENVEMYSYSVAETSPSSREAYAISVGTLNAHSIPSSFEGRVVNRVSDVAGCVVRETTHSYVQAYLTEDTVLDCPSGSGVLYVRHIFAGQDIYEAAALVPAALDADRSARVREFLDSLRVLF